MTCTIGHLLQCSPADVIMPFSMVLITTSILLFVLGIMKR